MRSKRIATAIAVLFGIGVALALLEVGVRIAGLAPPLPLQYGDNVADEAIISIRRPGSRLEGTAGTGEFAFRYDHNSLGFRDIEHAEAKAAGTLRIVALGDSFTYGVGADFADTYLVQVERRLNARAGPHRPVEIIKLGLPRHYPRLERLTLERYGLRFQPDVIMVALLPNDVVDSQEELDTCVSSSGYLVPCGAGYEWRARIAEHSALGRLVFTSLTRLTAPTGHWTDLFRDDGPYEPGWRMVETELTRMADLARQHGAAFVVAAIPQSPPWREQHAYAEARLARWSAAHGATFIPTLDALRAAPGQLYWKRDGHCTPAGYAVVGATIATALEQHGLAP